MASAHQTPILVTDSDHRWITNVISTVTKARYWIILQVWSAKTSPCILMVDNTVFRASLRHSPRKEPLTPVLSFYPLTWHWVATHLEIRAAHASVIFLPINVALSSNPPGDRGVKSISYWFLMSCFISHHSGIVLPANQHRTNREIPAMCLTFGWQVK